MPGIMSKIQSDIRRFTADSGGFAVPIVFTTSGRVDPVVTVTINGVAVKHNTTVGPMGEQISTSTARVMVTEQVMIGAGYPTRDGSNNIALKGDIVSYADAEGNTYTGIIRQVSPNNMTDLITLTLGDKK